MFSLRRPSPCPPPTGADTDDDLWSGPDDLWPESQDDDDNHQSDDDNRTDTVTLLQWGLRLPDGTVSWGSWQGIPCDNPLDRMRMIATLQKTALSIGFAEGDQVAAFLGNYGWVTRQAVVSTVYSSETHSYALGDPVVAEVHRSRQEEVTDD